ncbi:MAG: DedA family protein [Thermomicrobiales bacterium]
MGSTVQSLLLHYGLPLVALLIFAGEIGLPTFIPVEVALLLVGSQAVGSFPALLVGLVLVTVADILGTTTLHLVARTGGVRLLSRFLPDHESRPNSSVERLRQRLAGRDALAVFVLRLIPLVRMWTAVGTGLLRIRVRDFLLGAVPAALLWAGTPLALGYYFRDSVRGFEARYAAVSHVLLFVVPSLGLVVLFAIYVRRGDSPCNRLRRARLAIGLTVVLASVAYLIETVWRTTWAVDRGLLILPLPLRIVWLIALGGVALVLLRIAYADLRAERTARQRHIPSELAVAELISTVGWLMLLSLVGTIVAVIE